MAGPQLLYGMETASAPPPKSWVGACPSTELFPFDQQLLHHHLSPLTDGPTYGVSRRMEVVCSKYN